MLFATTETGARIRASKGASGSCSQCHGLMIPKCGSIVTPHWAHKTLIDCDTWTEPETEWHREWKSHFRPEEVEVIIKRDDLCHRADVHLTVPINGFQTIEFQHSPISVKDIENREEFYETEKLIWVFDVRDAYDSNRFWFEPTDGTYDGRPLKRSDWKHGRKSCLECFSQVYLDLGQANPDKPHWLFCTSLISTYKHWAVTEWGTKVSNRMYVTGYFQTKAQFLSTYATPSTPIK